MLPQLNLLTTENKQHLYGGLRGDISEFLKYDISAHQREVDNLQLFQKSILNDGSNAFAFNNAFEDIYDSGTVQTLTGMLRFLLTETVTFSLRGDYNQYDMDKFKEDPIGKPKLTGEADLIVKALKDRLILSATGFYMGERPDELSYVNSLGSSVLKTRPSFVDANLKVSYQTHQNLSLYLQVLNLVGENYEDFVDYQVFSRQYRAGFFFKF
ncbi:MAG: hypothetical protein C4K58_08140 [Flavobacteriaceae bacterium]|nr:MAG: hypothetical protein C4K58_08140 [Flavobacteriaceae bacterium]